MDLWANAAKKTKSGWSCGECMVDNPDGTVVCSCCSTPKPGAKPPPVVETAHTWTFGGQQPVVSPPRPEEAKTVQPSAGGFTINFGGAPVSVAPATTSAPSAFSGFSFGASAAQTAPAVSTSSIFGSQPLTNGNLNILMIGWLNWNSASCLSCLSQLKGKSGLLKTRTIAVRFFPLKNIFFLIDLA